MSRSVILAIGETTIHQIDGLYSLNDLHKAAGGETKYQPAKFTALESTKALIAEIGNSPDSESLRITTGRNGGTYACRELVIAYAAWISPAFHLKVIRVFLEAISPPAAKPAPPFDWGAEIEATNFDPREAPPPEVQEAIDARAWTLMLGVHALLRRHIERRVAGNPARALEIVEQTSLSDAIAPAHHKELRTVIGLMDAMIAVAHKARREMTDLTQRENMP